MTSDGVLAHLRARMPQFVALGPAELLSGGFLNCVWRVRGRSGSLIVKVAPPHVASQPDIELDPGRIIVEARILAAFGPDGALSSVGGPDIRPPRLLDFDESQYTLVMEDVGECPHIGDWLWRDDEPVPGPERIGQLVGAFIGALHAKSYGDIVLAHRFDNAAMQRARLRVHYRAVERMCVRAGLPDAQALGRRAVELGERFQEPGVCVIMGDLWPPSILASAKGLRVIDWELAHFGRPSQDVGHLAAHLWMWAHRAPDLASEARARRALGAFLAAYRIRLGDRADRLIGSDALAESAVHFGAEILVRAVGAFKEGYLYGGLSVDHPVVREAVAAAAEHLRHPRESATFEAPAL